MTKTSCHFAYVFYMKFTCEFGADFKLNLTVLDYKFSCFILLMQLIYLLCWSNFELAHSDI